MKLCLVRHAPLPALVALTTFLTRETQPLPFSIQVTTSTGVCWAEDLLWQLRTRAPDGSEREAIFASVEGIVVRCQPVNALSCVLMCNLLLPWDAWLEQEHEQVRITSTSATLLFVHLPSA